MDTVAVGALKTIFYENYFNNFLLSNLQDVEKLYIPLCGYEFDDDTYCSLPSRKPIPDIESRIITNLSSFPAKEDVKACKSYVVLGDGGTGKSTLALSLANQYWKREENMVPLYIHLPLLQRLRQYCKDKSILRLFVLFHSAYFKGQSVDEVLDSISKLNRLVLILDGYDDLLHKFPLWESNKFSNCIQTVTFCRPEAMGGQDFDAMFSYKIKNVVFKPKYYFLAPFSPTQISSYVIKVVEFLRNLTLGSSSTEDSLIVNEPWIFTKEVTQNNTIWERDSSEFKHWIDLILPELGQISQTPFLLTVLLQVLPTIVEEYRIKGQSSFELNLIQLMSTEVGIFDQFTRKWFEYSTRKIVQKYPKLLKISKALPTLLEIYSQNLAFKVFSQNLGLIKDAKFPRKMTEEWNLWQPNEYSELQFSVIENAEISQLFPSEKDDKDVEKVFHLLSLRSGCLLRCFQFQSQGQNYTFQFLHSSILDYFVSRNIFKGLRASLNHHLKQVGIKSTEFSFSQESIRSPKYSGILNMLVQRAKVDQDFKSLLLSVVRSSREVASVGVMSSNAFTILTQAFRVWCNEDFSYVNIADADMSHCVFTNCDFKGTNMSRALLTGTNFYKSQLQASNFYHCHLARGLNLHLLEGVSDIGMKRVAQYKVCERENGKLYIVYRDGYGKGQSDLYFIDDVGTNRKSKFILGHSSWAVKSFVKLQNCDVILAVLTPIPVDHKAPQTFAVVDFQMPKSKVRLLDQSLFESEELPQKMVLNCSKDGYSFTNLTTELDEQKYILEILTVKIPNCDESIVCYRTCQNEEKTSNIIGFSYQYSVTTCKTPFHSSITSNQNISESNFAINHSLAGATLLAISCGGFVTLVELRKEKILFQKCMSKPVVEGQVVLTFLRFSPDGKYLVFDMGNTLYILPTNVEGNVESLKEVSLLGSKGHYDSVEDCDFTWGSQSLIAITYDHGSPLIINLKTGQQLQSIHLWYRCNTLSFLNFDNSMEEMQISCSSYTGRISTHKVYAGQGDPRSIQALNPQTDYHSLVNLDLVNIDVFVSFRGNYMAIISEIKHKFSKIDEKPSDKADLKLLLFKIQENSGKRKYLFEYNFETFEKRTVRVSFINEQFVCLMYDNIFQVFHCGKVGDQSPVRTEVVGGPQNFRKCWYHESSQQMIFQLNDSDLGIYSVLISPPMFAKEWTIQINQSRFNLDLIDTCGSSAANVFYYVNDFYNFAYIFPQGEISLCIVWNLNNGIVSALPVIFKDSSNDCPYRGEDVKAISTVLIVNDLPSILFIDFSVGSAASFKGVVNQAEIVLELEKVQDRYIYQLVQFTNYFVALKGRASFIFGTDEPWKSRTVFSPFHDIEGFQVIHNVQNKNLIKVLMWDNRNISMIELDGAAMESWSGEVDKFNGWRLLWCDPPNDQFSLLFSNTTNAVLSKDEDWESLSQRFGCKGKVLNFIHSYISLPSLFELVWDSRVSIFIRGMELSHENWVLLVIAKKKAFLNNQTKSIKFDFLDNHSGIIIEGIKNHRHFAFRADLVKHPDKSYGINVMPLRPRKEKYIQLYKRYLATEFHISNQQGMTIIDKILLDTQSEIDYHLRYANCNTWVKHILSLIGINVERTYQFVDLSNDFFKKKDSRNVCTFPGFTLTGLSS